MSVQGRIDEGGLPRSDSDGWRMRMVGFGGGSVGDEVPVEVMWTGPASTADV